MRADSGARHTRFSERDAQVRLDTSRTVCVGRLPKSRTARRCIKPGKSVSVERVKELHAEGPRRAFGQQRESFGDIQVFIQRRKLADVQRARRIAKGKVRSRRECLRIQSATLPVYKCPVFA